MKSAVKRIVASHPFLASVVSFLRDVTNNCVDVTEGAKLEIGSNLDVAWTDQDIPHKQRRIVEQQLAEYRKGAANEYFDGLVDILSSNVVEINAKSLLEIGCASGYYSEIFRMKGIEAQYTGCDYSEALIRLARKCYSDISFQIEDARQLSYVDEAFDLVVSATCLLHIAEYGAAIREAARVARELVIFYNTPVVHRTGPLIFKKKAYDVEMFEIHFNEGELLRLFAANSLSVVDVRTHAISWKHRYNDALEMKTFCCRKTK